MSEESIFHLIPQKPPFVMIDELLFTDEFCTKTSFRIKKENVLVMNGEFSEAGLMENMAQTAAAGAKYRITIAYKSGNDLKNSFQSEVKKETELANSFFLASKKNETGLRQFPIIDKPAAIGYIASVKNFEINRLPKIGEELITEIKIENQIFDFTLLTGKIMSDNYLVAQCEMKVFMVI